MLGRDRRTRRMWSARSLVALLAISAMLLATTAACTSRHPHYASIGAGVSVGDGAPKDTKAAAGSTDAGIPLTEAVTPQISITASSQPAKTVTLQFALAQPLGPNDQVVAAWRETPDADWQFNEVTAISQDRKTVTVQTDHFSIWQILRMGAAIVNEFKKDVIDPLTGDLFTNAEKPTCQNQDKAYRDGYGTVLAPGGNDTMYWCFGIENNVRVVKVVNRMRYPLSVSHKGLKVLKAGAITAEIKELAKIGSGDNTILYPFEEADFQLPDLQPDQNVVIAGEYDGWADFMYTLEVAVDSFLAVISAAKLSKGVQVSSKLIAGKTPAAIEIMDKITSIASCANALATLKSGDFIKSCLTEKNLKVAFGAVGLLVGPVVAAFDFLEFLRSQVNAVLDQITGKGKFNLTVGCSSKGIALFKEFVGDWIIEDETMTVKSDYTGKMWMNNFYDCTPYPDECGIYLDVEFIISGKSLKVTVLHTTYADVGTEKPITGCKVCKSLNGKVYYFQFTDKAHNVIGFFDANGKSIGGKLCRSDSSDLDSCFGSGGGD